MKLSLGFSPCPNDTFIFDALVNNKIDTEGFEFDVVLEDVETLNKWAIEEKLDLTKLSFPALFDNSDKYVIFSSGAALGKGVGPILVSKSMVAVPDVAHCSIAIPGKNTTANFLLHFAFPEVKNTVPMLFSDIEDAVLGKKVELGVIIHENRFTYREKGLIKICDLGELWEQKHNLPIPLGCIAGKRKLPADVLKKVEYLLRKSIEYAFTNYPLLPTYTISNAQEMNEEVMRKHIELYVNDFSVELGEEGKKAIAYFYDVYLSKKGTPKSEADQLFR
ncbi:MAG: 1,4-dihydroxy-6-naphthoate synthase [Chitinophagaceae bacterium]